MNKFTNAQANRMGYRGQLLATASVIVLLGSAYGAGNARAADSDNDRPQLWIELGGQYTLVDTGEQRYAPPFVSLLPTTLPSPLPAQRLPGNAFGWNGKLSFEPNGSDWVFSASVRYGRSAAAGHVQKTLALASPYAAGADYVDSKSYEQETHAILDFMVGKDVGFGMFGGAFVFSGGLRDVQFTTSQTASILGDPNVPELFNSAVQAKRDFHGIGPAVSLDAFVPVLGNAQNGEVTLDWGANAAVLFGRRKVDIHHQTSECYYQQGRYSCPAVYSTHGTIPRSRQATVPNLGGFVAISMRYTNAKISLGYRADEFFGAKDGGLASAKNYNLGFYGPFATISVGIGG